MLKLLEINLYTLLLKYNVAIYVINHSDIISKYIIVSFFYNIYIYIYK